MCYHALNRPEIAEGHVDEFNKAFPHFTLSGENVSDTEDPHGKEGSSRTTVGDEFMQKAQNLRARMVPQDHWPTNIKAFQKAWEKWKAETYRYDFTDLIDRGITELPFAPGEPTVGFFDECQDFTRLQMKLLRQWADNMEYVLMAGDDDQLLFAFAGATTDAFLEPPIPDRQKEVLTQSYRVPATVHRLAEKWIRQVERREEKEYKPRDYEGEVKLGLGSASNPLLFMNQIEAWAKGEGETVMILASCAYMLNATIQLLRERGLPFHNPYRVTNGAWNPLTRRKGAVMTVDRLSSFVNPSLGFPPVWSMKDIHNFIGHIKAKGVILRGAKHLPKQFCDDGVEMPESLGPGYLDFLQAVFEDDVATELFNQLKNGIDPTWLVERVLGTKKRMYNFPMRVLESQGNDALSDTPKITVGTVHSVKGGEADNVIFMPDLSMAGQREWIQRGVGRDSIVRMTYVAMTRARKRLHILRPAGSMFVDMSSVRGLIN